MQVRRPLKEIDKEFGDNCFLLYLCKKQLWVINLSLLIKLKLVVLLDVVFFYRKRAMVFVTFNTLEYEEFDYYVRWIFVAVPNNMLDWIL